MRKKNAHAVALGRLGGRAKSEKKTAAARRNAMMSSVLRQVRTMNAYDYDMMGRGTSGKPTPRPDSR